jgi:DedD protein
MEQARLKYRIVGGIVLVALAAILVPLLNDVRRPLPQGPQAIDIPSEPTGGLAGQLPAEGAASEGLVPEPQDLPEPLPAPPLAGQDEAPMMDGGALPEPATPIAPDPVKPAPAAAPKPAPPKPAAPIVAKPSIPKPAPTPTVAQPAPAPKPSVATPTKPATVAKTVPAVTPAPAATPAPKLQTPSPAPSAAPATAQQAWVVQLGVYGNLKTAIDLRERLRKAGHSAFTEEVTTPHGKALRVRVGPELDRAAALSLRDRLARETGHEGIVVGYP